MRTSTWLVALTAAAAVLSMQSVAETNIQQEKMKTCNTEATGKNLTGDARKTFMQKCLSHEAEPAAKGNSQQEKMKACNKTASGKGLKGDERQAFMKDCLSAKPQ